MILNDFKGMPLLPPTKEKVNAIARDVCHLSVCLSVSKIIQKRVHGLG